MTREPTEMERRGAIAIATLRVGGGDPQVGAWVFERMSESDQADYDAEARAVIRTMGDPTVAMVDNGAGALDNRDVTMSDEHYAITTWQAMIDAASPPEGARTVEGDKIDGILIVWDLSVPRGSMVFR